MGYLLVTNDFPPKVGGIQSYLYELFRRLPPDELTVLTTSHRGAAAFDRRQRFRIERWSSPVLLPTPRLARAVRQLAQTSSAKLVLLDPALPVGLLGRRLDVPLRSRAARGRGDSARPTCPCRVSCCARCSRGPRSRSPRAGTPVWRRRAQPGRERPRWWSSRRASTTCAFAPSARDERGRGAPEAGFASRRQARGLA